MKQVFILPRSTATSHLPHYSVQCSILFLSVIFLIPVAHSRTNRDIDQGLRHKQIVDQFKTKVLQHMGLNGSPKGYNASRDSLHGKLIREFFRKKLKVNVEAQKGDTNDNHDKTDDNSVGDLQTMIFTSTDPELWVPLQPANTPPPASYTSPSASYTSPTASSEITVVTFSTNFQQPEVPFHYLVIRSAILRMSISRQKRLHPKHKKSVKLSVYLLSQLDGILKNDDTSNLIYSGTVNIPKVRTLEININLQLMSNIIESENKSVIIGIKIEDNNEKIKGKHSKQKRKVSSSQEQLRISKMELELSTLVKDFRKTRAKRQAHERCIENMCCKHSIYIDFEDIGWSDWVLSPTGYTAYFCDGGCSDTYKIASTFTGIKSLLHERMPDVVPAPVCAPTDYNSLDMIIFDGELKDVSYPGMVVSGCRCY